jgi:hypothetical protein
MDGQLVRPAYRRGKDPAEESAESLRELARWFLKGEFDDDQPQRPEPKPSLSKTPPMTPAICSEGGRRCLPVPSALEVSAGRGTRSGLISRRRRR